MTNPNPIEEIKELIKKLDFKGLAEVWHKNDMNWHEEEWRAFVTSIQKVERDRVKGIVESKQKEYGTIGEKADTFFMKGIPSDGYSLDQAAEDAKRYCHYEECLSDLLTALEKEELEKSAEKALRVIEDNDEYYSKLG